MYFILQQNLTRVHVSWSYSEHCWVWRQRRWLHAQMTWRWIRR